jgi:hypothetical protein
MADKHTQGKVHIRSTFAQHPVLYIDGPEESIAKTTPLVYGNGTREANAERIAALWNAADGMPTEEAVKYIEHGPKWDKMIEDIIDTINDEMLDSHNVHMKISGILAGLED